MLQNKAGRIFFFSMHFARRANRNGDMYRLLLVERRGVGCHVVVYGTTRGSGISIFMIEKAIMAVVDYVFPLLNQQLASNNVVIKRINSLSVKMSASHKCQWGSLTVLSLQR